ncbi:sigma 54-interacting transcriptional regulator [Peribacillus butanolivorans]|uniref:sigma 54-interacting transcriptional regulator n=1 Tax=Peribacillus butanolivorans TaxID=421767 RepID=UPI00167F669D|nr:sigma-54 factor interaction domain-containing protein [Peribacillus butanolivorans]
MLGESGIGKDVLANFINEQRKRKGPLIKINCGAIPDHYQEQEKAKKAVKQLGERRTNYREKD